MEVLGGSYNENALVRHENRSCLGTDSGRHEGCHVRVCEAGAGYGYTGVKGLNALLATVSTASSAPVIVATRLRRGSANSARGAARLVADAIKTTRAYGVDRAIVLRADSVAPPAAASSDSPRPGSGPSPGNGCSLRRSDHQHRPDRPTP